MDAGGLKKVSKAMNYVPRHLPDEVGMRHGRSVMLEIDSAKMQADGYVSYVTHNLVWLTAHVSVGYLRVVDCD